MRASCREHGCAEHVCRALEPQRTCTAGREEDMSFTTGPSGVYDVFTFEERRLVRMENNAADKTEKLESCVRATFAAPTAHRTPSTGCG